MNFTQNTLNIYKNYLFKHCNAVVLDFCTPQDSHSVRDKAHFAFVTPEASCATLNYLHKHKLMPLIFQYNFIANTFGLYNTVCKLIHYYLERGNGRRGRGVGGLRKERGKQ